MGTKSHNGFLSGDEGWSWGPKEPEGKEIQSHDLLQGGHRICGPTDLAKTLPMDLDFLGCRMNISAKGYWEVGGGASLGPGAHQGPRQNVLGEERG